MHVDHAKFLYLRSLRFTLLSTYKILSFSLLKIQKFDLFLFFKIPKFCLVFFLRYKSSVSFLFFHNAKVLLALYHNSIFSLSFAYFAKRKPHSHRTFPDVHTTLNIQPPHEKGVVHLTHSKDPRHFPSILPRNEHGGVVR